MRRRPTKVTYPEIEKSAPQPTAAGIDQALERAAARSFRYAVGGDSSGKPLRLSIRINKANGSTISGLIDPRNAPDH
jgi:hypothetical protein